MKRFALGGIRFESEAALGELSEEHVRFLAPESEAPIVVRLIEDRRLSPEGIDGRSIVHEASEGGGRVETRDAVAEYRVTGARAFEVRAHLHTPPYGLSHLTTALTGALVERLGGLVLHSAALLVEGSALALIGPTEAGKTSAARLCPELPWIAKDRLAAMPTEEGWRAWSMPGGDEIEHEQAPNFPRPLRAVLRVRRSTERFAVEPTDGARAAAAILECAQRSSAADPFPTAMALMAAVPQGDLIGPLREPLTARLLEGLRALPLRTSPP